jgi:MSHA pilin protein MshC
MRIAQNEIPTAVQAVKKHPGASSAVWLFGSRMEDDQRGFTLIELIMVIVIVGILAVVVLPRFYGVNVFNSRGFADQVQATLRYAQKEAIAQHRNVCVAMAANDITLTIANAIPSLATSPCNTNLALPGQATNIISTPSAAITLTLAPAIPPTFIFGALGKPWDAAGVIPSAQKLIAISGATNNIVVEAETGYVHSP